MIMTTWSQCSQMMRTFTASMADIAQHRVFTIAMRLIMILQLNIFGIAAQYQVDLVSGRPEIDAGAIAGGTAVADIRYARYVYAYRDDYRDRGVDRPSAEGPGNRDHDNIRDIIDDSIPFLVFLDKSIDGLEDFREDIHRETRGFRPDKAG